MKSIKEEIKQKSAFRNSYHKGCVNLIYTGKWIINLHGEIFKQYGLTLQQYNILRILKGLHPEAATIKLLKDRMLDKMSDASRIVELLNKKKLLSRTLNDADRRKVDIRISRKGLDLLAKTEKENKKMDNLLSNLDNKEIELLNALLDKVRK